MRRFAFRSGVALLALLICTGDGGAEPVSVIVGPEAAPVERLAAEELASYLGRLYPDETFRVEEGPVRVAGRRILLGTPRSTPALLARLDRSNLEVPESCLVTSVRQGGESPCGVIAGADPTGVLHGVYRLLETLGFGFYLDFETAPPPRHEAWTPAGWELADHPLVTTRLVLNWHNFLSGCTGWDYPQWRQWVLGAQKMGFNTIMVHAYGNNPMFTFSFNGIEKPVGYVATSRRGRDWGNEHVNDVRRLPGGKVFPAAEFGSKAARVPEDQRVAAKQALMKRVFALAESRGVDVCFALDVDTASVLTQDITLSLPESARFHNGHLWLPRPDTAAGYALYKAQVEALFALYPGIDILALWRRSNAQEWGRLKGPEQLPEPWRQQYERHVARRPAAGKLTQAVASFALSKVAAALRRELNETGHADVRIAMGSWATEWVPACAEFLPEEISLMPLDSNCLRYRRGSFFEVPAAFSDLDTARGRILPIIWAHHDDGDYIGRPYRPHQNFHDTLAKLDARGYGIIHWMTRPLDLYFKNHENQVWATRENEPYEQTCRRAAHDWFGRTSQEALGSHLRDWWTSAPIFGRVTTDHFFTNGYLSPQSIRDPDRAMAGCRARLARLRGIDTSSMTPRQRERLRYFTALEEALISFCEVQAHAYRNAVRAMESADFETARAQLQSADPTDTIRRFATLSELDGGNRGEQAMVLSLGTRWITDYLAAAQAAGQQPIRINYGPTRHEPLAQGAGSYTFHVDGAGRYWSVRGSHETKRKVVELAGNAAPPALQEITRTGILIDQPTVLPLTPLVSGPKALAPSPYHLTLYLASVGGDAAVDVEVKGNSPGLVTYRRPPAREKSRRIACSGNRVTVKHIDLTLTRPGKVVDTLIPVSGRPVCCAVVLGRRE